MVNVNKQVIPRVPPEAHVGFLPGSSTTTYPEVVSCLDQAPRILKSDCLTTRSHHFLSTRNRVSNLFRPNVRMSSCMIHAA
eukprot:scaffold263163_cov17-Tisochrysis_lutea.AAC.1